MSTDNGNGTHVSGEIDFLVDVQCRVVDLEAIASGIPPLLHDLPMLPAGSKDERERRARLAVQRLIALTRMLARNLAELLRDLDTLVRQREHQRQRGNA